MKRLELSIEFRSVVDTMSRLSQYVSEHEREIEELFIGETLEKFISKNDSYAIKKRADDLIKSARCLNCLCLNFDILVKRNEKNKERVIQAESLAAELLEEYIKSLKESK